MQISSHVKLAKQEESSNKLWIFLTRNIEEWEEARKEIIQKTYKHCVEPVTIIMIKRKKNMSDIPPDQKEILCKLCGCVCDDYNGLWMEDEGYLCTKCKMQQIDEELSTLSPPHLPGTTLSVCPAVALWRGPSIGAGIKGTRKLTEGGYAMKNYYQNEVLNRLANEVWGGRVYGEETMLDMLREAPDEAGLIEAVEESLL